MYNITTSDDYYAIHEVLVTKLRLLKQGENTKNIRIDLERMKGEINKIVDEIIKITKTNIWDHSSVTLLLVRLNIIQKFSEVVLNLKDEFLPMKNVFLEVLHKNCRLFHLLLSVKIRTPTAIASIAETLSFFLYALHKFDLCESYFDALNSHLSETHGEENSTTLALRIIEHLCRLGEEYICEPFDNFLFNDNGILRGEFILGQMENRTVNTQILVFRIYSKTLTMKSCSRGRCVLLKDIEQILKWHGHVTENALLHDQFWNFVTELIPFPRESEVEISDLSRSCEEILRTLPFKHVTELETRRRYFGGYQSELEEVEVCNVTLVNIINLVLKCTCWILLSESLDCLRMDFIQGVLSHWRNIILTTVCQRHDGTGGSDANMAEHMISAFSEQDDDLVDQLLLQIEMYHLLRKRMDTIPKESGIMNPHSLFIELLASLSFDSSVLLDWLVSNETRFLLYLLKYLKYATSSWEEFAHCCALMDRKPNGHDGHCLTPQGCKKAMNCCFSTLSKLRLSIIRLNNSKLFPYSPGPLLKHLDAIERLYHEEIAQKQNKSMK